MMLAQHLIWDEWRLRRSRVYYNRMDTSEALDFVDSIQTIS